MASPNQGAPEQRPVLSKVEARQGVTGHNVRYVLWFGLGAVIVALSPFICLISYEIGADERKSAADELMKRLHSL